MPLFSYHPEGLEPQEWDIEFGKIMSPERIAIEKLTGLTWNEFQRRVWDDDSAAVHALLYVLLKRDRPTLRPADVQFSGEDYFLDLSEREARNAIRNIRDAKDPDEDDVESLARLLKKYPDPEPEPVTDAGVLSALDDIEAAEFPKAESPT